MQQASLNQMQNKQAAARGHAKPALGGHHTLLERFTRSGLGGRPPSCFGLRNGVAPRSEVGAVGFFPAQALLKT